jgi:hypothetical protein
VIPRVDLPALREAVAKKSRQYGSIYCGCGAMWNIEYSDSPIALFHAKHCGPPVSHEQFIKTIAPHKCKCDLCRTQRKQHREHDLTLRSEQAESANRTLLDEVERLTAQQGAYENMVLMRDQELDTRLAIITQLRAEVSMLRSQLRAAEDRADMRTQELYRSDAYLAAARQANLDTQQESNKLAAELEDTQADLAAARAVLDTATLAERADPFISEVVVITVDRAAWLAWQERQR